MSNQVAPFTDTYTQPYGSNDDGCDDTEEIEVSVTITAEGFAKITAENLTSGGEDETTLEGLCVGIEEGKLVLSHDAKMAIDRAAETLSHFLVN